jgi:hypothetical protein
MSFACSSCGCLKNLMCTSAKSVFCPCLFSSLSSAQPRLENPDLNEKDALFGFDNNNNNKNNYFIYAPKNDYFTNSFESMTTFLDYLGK